MVIIATLKSLFSIFLLKLGYLYKTFKQPYPILFLCSQLLYIFLKLSLKLQVEMSFD